MMKHNLARKNTGVDTRMESEQPRPQKVNLPLLKLKDGSGFIDGWEGWTIINPADNRMCYHLVNGQKTFIFYHLEAFERAREYLLDNDGSRENFERFLSIQHLQLKQEER